MTYDMAVAIRITQPPAQDTHTQKKNKWGTS